MCAAQFFMPFMMAGVNAVLPPLGESLGASARELSLVAAVYSLGLVIFQLAGGTLGDIFGRRRVFLAGMAIFGCTSIVLGFVGDMTLFIALRLVQGTGCALLSSCSLALLVSAAPSELRASYLGISGAAVYAGIACGPPLAGCVAGWLRWQWLFWLTGLAALGAMLRYILKNGWSGRMTKQQAVDAVYRDIEKNGFLSVIPRGYSAGHPVMPRKQELYGVLNRWRR